jgi:hypothetical protein
VSSIPPGHPIVGSWTMTSKDGLCSETYRFSADGTVLVTSGDEVAEIRSELAAEPSSRGFYRWRHTVEKHNGKRDCSGNLVNPGDSATWFIQLDPSKERLIMCKEESTMACFGPLRRVHGGAA